MGDYVDEAVARIREQVGDEEVILGLSGGVDSSVAAALIHRRSATSSPASSSTTACCAWTKARLVMEMFAGRLHVEGDRGRRQRQFLGSSPAWPTRRPSARSSAASSSRSSQREAAKLPSGEVAGAGHDLPRRHRVGRREDQEGDTIKSHHNVGGLPETLGLKLLEPLRELFKDEVRELGLALGLPHEMVYRHPFPGPGLGVRILGEVKREYADLLRRADAIFIEELRATLDPASRQELVRPDQRRPSPCSCRCGASA